MIDIQDIVLKRFPHLISSSCTCHAGHKACLQCTKCRNIPVYPVDFGKHLNEYIDHTNLKPDAQSTEIIKLCEEANVQKFKSVCANATHIDLVKTHLSPTIKICSVIGFPLGATISAVKLYEAEKAIKAGANEIDMVINIGKLKDFEYTEVYNEIEAIASVCEKNKVILKVIIETCLLTDMEIITACIYAKKAGVDFIKTSTGFSTKGATIKDVKLIREVVGPNIGVKASGGIKTNAEAIAMLKAGANRLGTSASLRVMNYEL